MPGLERKVEAKGVATSVSRKEQANSVGNKSVPAASSYMSFSTAKYQASGTNRQHSARCVRKRS